MRSFLMHLFILAAAPFLIVATAGAEGIIVLPDCSFTMSFVSDGTRTGDTSTGVSINTLTYTGSGCFFEDTCTRLETSSVRTSDNPDCEATPVASASWGAIKSVYR